MADSIEDEIVRQLRSAHPGSVTKRSLRSLVVGEAYSREEFGNAIDHLESERTISKITERGLTRYRLSGRSL